MAEPTEFQGQVSSVADQFTTAWTTPVPLLVLVSIVAFGIWQAMNWRYAGTIARLESDLAWAKEQLSRLSNEKGALQHERAGATEQAVIDQTSTVLALPAEVAKREFVSENTTLEEIIVIKNKERSVANDRYIQTFEGKWIRFNLVVASCGTARDEIVIAGGSEDAETVRDVITSTVYLYFKKITPRIEAIAMGDRIAGMGLIEDISWIGTTLSNCELDP